MTICVIYDILQLNSFKHKLNLIFMKKSLLISLVIAVEVFLFGVLQYCLAPDDEYTGNYLMAIGSLGVCITGFVFFVKKTRALLKINTLRARVKMFIFPIFGAYMLHVGLVMLDNILNMYYHGYSMINAWIDTTTSLLVTIRYLDFLVFFEAIIYLAYLLKKKK